MPPPASRAPEVRFSSRTPPGSRPRAAFDAVEQRSYGLCATRGRSRESRRPASVEAAVARLFAGVGDARRRAATRRRRISRTRSRRIRSEATELSSRSLRPSRGAASVCRARLSRPRRRRELPAPAASHARAALIGVAGKAPGRRWASSTSAKRVFAGDKPGSGGGPRDAVRPVAGARQGPDGVGGAEDGGLHRLDLRANYFVVTIMPADGHRVRRQRRRGACTSSSARLPARRRRRRRRNRLLIAPPSVAGEGRRRRASGCRTAPPRAGHPPRRFRADGRPQIRPPPQRPTSPLACLPSARRLVGPADTLTVCARPRSWIYSVLNRLARETVDASTVAGRPAVVDPAGVGVRTGSSTAVAPPFALMCALTLTSGPPPHVQLCAQGRLLGRRGLPLGRDPQVVQRAGLEVGGLQPRLHLLRPAGAPPPPAATTTRAPSAPPSRGSPSLRRNR